MKLLLFVLLLGAPILQPFEPLNTHRQGRVAGESLLLPAEEALWRRYSDESQADLASGRGSGDEGSEGENLVEQSLRGPCDSPHLNYLAFFPCTCGGATGGCTAAILRECDVFLYPAALLAVEHVNKDNRVLHFPEYQVGDDVFNIINADVHLVESETKVSS